MRPGVARQYLEEVVDDFERYAKAHYVPALSSPSPDPDLLLAGVTYVGTRELDGYEWQLRELLTSRVPRRIEAEFDGACLRAIINTTEDHLGTARYIALAGSTRASRSASRRYENALEDLGPTAHVALLIELGAQHHDAAQLRRMAAQLRRLSRVSPPLAINEWIDMDVVERRAALDAWRRHLRARGQLPPDPPPDLEGPPAPSTP